MGGAVENGDAFATRRQTAGSQAGRLPVSLVASGRPFGPDDRMATAEMAGYAYDQMDQARTELNAISN